MTAVLDSDEDMWVRWGGRWRCLASDDRDWTAQDVERAWGPCTVHSILAPQEQA